MPRLPWLFRLTLLLLALPALAASQTVDGSKVSGYFVVGLPDSEARVIVNAYAALARYADRSPTARHARDLMAHRTLAIPWHLDSTTVVAGQLTDSTSLLTVAPSAIEFAPGAFTSAAFEPRSRTLVLMETRYGSLVTGMQMVHELDHAERCAGCRDTSFHIFTPAWFAEELRAHNAAYHFLKEVSSGGWLRAVKAAATERDSMIARIGVESFTFGATLNDSALVVGLFGPQPARDLSSLVMQLNIDANLYRIAQRSPPGLVESRNLQFMEYYYRKIGILPVRNRGQ